MSSPEVSSQAERDTTVPDRSDDHRPLDDFRAVFTWTAFDVVRLEQARVQVSGLRIKAYGQIIAAATEAHPAFNATYDLVTNDDGETRRLAVHLVRESGETQLSITRDAENTWLVQTPNGTERSGFGGAKDVDLVLSPLFNALPIRRLNLHRETADVAVPVCYLRLPDCTVEAVTSHYRSDGTGVRVDSPVGTAQLTTDAAGFVRSYPGLADRV